MAVKINGEVALKLRQEHGENQSTFWGRLGCTQSAGSRYESGRRMPVPLKKLYYLIYMTSIPSAITTADWNTFVGVTR